VLKFREETRYIPFVMITGKTAVPDRVSGLEAGADDYLLKPIEPAELIARVRSTGRLGAYRKIISEREKLRAAMAEASDALVLMTSDWRVVSANAAARRLMNVWKPGSDALIDLVQRFRLSVDAAALRSGRAREVRFEMVRPTGNPPLVLAAALTRIGGEIGDASDLVLAVRDVTVERIESLAKDDFVSLASHKLRTPLAIVMGNLSLLLDGSLGELTAEQTGALRDMSHGVGDLGRIVERLIRFASLGSAELRLDPIRVPLGEVADRVRDAAARSAAAHGGKRVEISVDEALLDDAVYVDPWAVAELVDCLVDNAVKFCDKAVVHLRVRQRKAREGFVGVAIADNGPGIPHEKVEAVFDSFRQIDSELHDVEGLGLGLPTVRRLVSRAGGRVAIESEIGRGTTVVIELPAASGLDEPVRDDAPALPV
jgi:signal transduction histidine kinase